MMARLGWLCLGVFFLGCHPLPKVVDPEDARRAKQLWQQGETQFRDGHHADAITAYEESLVRDPRLIRNHISLAAAYLRQDRPEEACSHLGRYLEAEPEHVLVRVHHADLLLRLRRVPEARDEFGRCDADAQAQPELDPQHRVHCQSRLMEIADEAGDTYSRHLHRGIGLYLIGCLRVGLGEDEGELSSEGLFCKAAAELTQAHRCRSTEARPCWYLAQVWAKLGQRQPSQRWLRLADEAALLSELTDTERGQLQTACLRRDAERVTK